MEEQLAIDVEHDDGAAKAVVRVAGEIDTASADELRAALDRVVVAGATEVCVDLGEVPFMDSTGLSVLIHTGTQLAGRGSVAVTAASPAVKRTIDVAGLGEFLAFP